MFQRNSNSVPSFKIPLLSGTEQEEKTNRPDYDYMFSEDFIATQKNIILKHSQKAGQQPGMMLNQREMEAILALIHDMRIDEQGQTQGCYDAFIMMLNTKITDFSHSPSSTALREVRKNIIKQVKFNHPHLNNETTTEAKFAETTRDASTIDYFFSLGFVKAQKQIFIDASIACGQMDETYLNPDIVDPLLNTIRSYSSNSPLDMEDFLKNLNATIENYKQANPRCFGTHRFATALEEVRKNIQRAVTTGQPQFTQQYQAAEEERSSKRGSAKASYICDGITCLCCCLEIIPQKILSMNDNCGLANNNNWNGEYSSDRYGQNGGCPMIGCFFPKYEERPKNGSCHPCHPADSMRSMCKDMDTQKNIIANNQAPPRLQMS